MEEFLLLSCCGFVLAVHIVFSQTLSAWAVGKAGKKNHFLFQNVSKIIFNQQESSNESCTKITWNPIVDSRCNKCDRFKMFLLGWTGADSESNRVFYFQQRRRATNHSGGLDVFTTGCHSTMDWTRCHAYVLLHGAIGLCYGCVAQWEPTLGEWTWVPLLGTIAGCRSSEVCWGVGNWQPSLLEWTWVPLLAIAGCDSSVPRMVGDYQSWSWHHGHQKGQHWFWQSLQVTFILATMLLCVQASNSIKKMEEQDSHKTQRLRRQQIQSNSKLTKKTFQNHVRFSKTESSRWGLRSCCFYWLWNSLHDAV